MSAPKCTQCEIQPERIYSLGVMSTLMAYQQYYDEDGNYHSHDPNRHEYNWRCSNGHVWSEVRYNPCGACNFNTKSA